MHKNSLWVCASALTLATAMAGAANAQEQESTEVEGLVITGTSIRGVAAAGSPTITLDMAQVEASGASTPSEAVRLLPQMLNLGADETRNSFTSVAGGGSAQDAAANATAVRSVNLRGIGPEATLLLVNGRRIPPSGVIKAISDLDLVPTNALSRIEVVADGASAIYGADAVAGVVNLITRRPTDIVEVFGRYGGASDMEGYSYGLTAGKTWDGGGVLLTYEAYYRSNLSGADRDFASQNRALRGGSDARSFFASPGNITLNPTTGAACTTAGTANAAGTATCRRYALPVTANGVVAPGAITASAGNRFDEAAYADLLPEQDRDSVYLTARHQVTDTIDVWYEGLYSYRSFEQMQPPASGNLTVPTTNAFFVRPAGVPVPVLPASQSINVEYRLLGDGDPDSEGIERTYLNSVGLGWDLPRDWRMEAYANFGVDDGVQLRQSVLNNNVMRTALASNNPATAFNPFDSGNFNQVNNPALFDLIDAERNQFATSRTDDFAVKFDGPIFGDVKLAVGAEYHDNSFDQALYATNTSNDGSVTTKFVKNDRQVTSLFAEVFAPLVSEDNARPGLQRFDVSVAARYDDYSDFGDTTNPKVGVIYGPTTDLTFRATYGTSFRAPSLVDSADQILNIFIQNVGDSTLPANTLRRSIFYNGGNSALTPEEASSWTFGADWEPTAVPGVRLSATYYNIEYTDRIDVVPNTAFTNTAYDPYTIRRGDIPDTDFNALVAAFMASPDLQNPPEAVTGINGIIDGRRQNLGRLNQDGIDLSALYTFETEIGDWTTGLEVSRILNLTRVTAAGSPEVDVLDKFANPVNIRSRASLGWQSGAWSAWGFLNYVDGYLNTAITPNRKVSSWTTLDASVSYDFGDEGMLKGTRLQLSGQNLLDEDPPVVLNGTVSWDSQAASPVGRYISVEVTKRF